MSEMETLLREIFEQLRWTIGSETWVQRRERVLRESGLLRLLEAGERARKKINHTGNDKMCESCMVCREYDAAKAAMKEKLHAK